MASSAIASKPPRRMKRLRARATSSGTVFAGSSILDSQAELVLRNLVVKVDRGSEPAAWSATRAFCLLNGYDIDLNVDRAETLVLGVAAGKIDVAEIVKQI